MIETAWTEDLLELDGADGRGEHSRGRDASTDDES